MAKNQIALTNFAAGELSPRMAGALESPLYRLGCKTMRNFLPGPGGHGAEKRPGTYYLGTTKGNREAVLIPYLDPTGASWMLELSGDGAGGTVRAWSIASRALDGGGAPLEVAAPYKAAELRAVRVAHDRGTLSLCHPSYALRQLRGQAGAWPALTTPTFIGAEYSVVADPATDTLLALGAQRLTEGLAVVVRASSGGTLPAPLVAGTTYYVKGLAISKRADSDEREQRFSLAATLGGAAIDLTTTGSGIVYVRVPSAAPFNAAGKYPRALAYHAGRLYLVEPPNIVWASRTFDAAAGVDRLDDFTLGTAPDAAISIREQDMASSPIYWLVSAHDLLAGSEWAEWASTGEVPTPATFDLRQAAPYGAADVAAEPFDQGVVYVRAGRRQVALLVFQEQGWRSLDLVEAADHIGAGRIRKLAVQSIPSPVIWAIDDAGILYSGSLQAGAGIIGWNPHPMAGGAVVEDIACTRGAVEDELWLVVRRGATRSIEVLAPRHFSQELDAHYVDCGLRLTPASKTVSGLAHLEGQEVEAWADGGILPKKTVTGGQVTYDRVVQDVHIGLAISSSLEPMRLVPDGTKSKITEVIVRLYRSLGGKIGPSAAHAQAIIARTPQTAPYGEAEGLHTKDVKLTYGGSVDEDTPLLFIHQDPAPCTVLALLVTMAQM